MTPFWGALATWFHAHVAVALQPPAESLPMIQDALDQFRAIGYHRLVVDALMLMGLTEMDDDVGRAEDHFHEALRVGIDAGAPLVMIDAIDVLGVTGMLHGLDADAARLLSVAATYRAEKQLPPARWEPRLATEIRPGLEARMGPDAYAAAVAQGRTLSLDEAVAIATKRRGSRSRPSVGWSSLTPAESRVVALAAEGLSNPQIADRLFIGRGTVKSHLAHAYLKLGIANRTELAAAVARRNTT